MKLKDLLKGCRSCRRYLQKPVSEEDVTDIVDHVRLGHCGNNRQLLRFYEVISEEACSGVAELVKYASLIPEGRGMPSVSERPAAYLVIAAPENPFLTRDVDAGIAAEIMTESAWEKGIGSCIIMNFPRPQMNELLNMEKGMTALIVVALGYASAENMVEEAENGNTAYRMDEHGGFHVPKLLLKDLIRRR